MLETHEALKERARRRIRDRKRMMAMLWRRGKVQHDVPGSWWRLETWDDVFRARDRYARRYYRNRKRCGGLCCKSMRKTAKFMGVQEYRAELDAREQYRELGIAWKPSRFRPLW